MSVVHRHYGDALQASRAAEADKRDQIALSARVRPIDMIATLGEVLPASPNEVIVYIEPAAARELAGELLVAAGDGDLTVAEARAFASKLRATADELERLERETFGGGS